MTNAEYQKPFSKIGQLNAEIVTRKGYCRGNDMYYSWCECPDCEDERNKRKREVNRLMKRDFYKNVPGESHE